MEETLERQLLIRGRATATFHTNEKAFAGRAGRMLCTPALDAAVDTLHERFDR